MLLAIGLLAIASLIGASVLLPQQRWLTFLATAGALFEMQWLLLTLIDRAVLPEISTATTFTVGSIVAVLLWATRWRKWQLPPIGRDQLIKEGSIIIILLITLLSARLISANNGFQPDGSWQTHGFFNGDTVTLAALTQASLDANTLLERNPFAAGTSLEYPTLLHASLATALTATDQVANWFKLMPLFTYVQILITVPLFFLIWDAVLPEPKETWQRWLGMPTTWTPFVVTTLITLYIMTLSWEGYVYLQSHFFLAAPFLLLVATLHTADRQSGAKQLCAVATGIALTITLMLGNAVTGTAALILALVFAGQRAAEYSRPRYERALALLIAVTLIVLFLYATPGNAAWTIIPGFSYTATASLLALAPALLALIIGILTSATRYRFLSAAAAALAIAATLVFLFSARNIIVENSSRFIYHALLVAFPLLAAPLIRAGVWLKRELRDTAHPLVENLTVWGAALVGLGVFLTPALASVASTHDNLLFKDTQTVSALEQEALGWIKQETPVDAVILASPNEPWAIPLFTGRSLLRTNYWLSPEDPLTAEVNAAFNGNVAAQEVAARKADYIFLTQDDAAHWLLFDSGNPIFSNNDVRIFRTIPSPL